MNELSYQASNKQAVQVLIGTAVFSAIGLFMALSDGTLSIHPGVYILTTALLLAFVAKKSPNSNPRIVMVGRLAGGVAIATVSLVYFLVPEEYQVRLWGIAAILFFGGGGALYAKKTGLKKRPLLKLTPSSITVSATNSHTFTWDQVASLSVVEQPLMMQKPYYYLAVIPKQDAQDNIPQPTGAAKASAAMIGSPFFAILNQAEETPETIISDIKTFLEANSIAIPVVHS